MAEFAETNIQATIPEIEEIGRLGLLYNEEIRALIEKRREWEYRLARRTKAKEDYIGFINYEKKLLELIKIRRNQMRLFEKYKEIEGAMHIRIMKRCRFISRAWPDHHDAWELRINFACQIGWYSEASVAYAEQVRYRGNIESLYISWARFEVEERNNMDSARKILLSKAPLYHPDSPLIKREHFRLELLYVESLKKRLEEDKAITEVIEENREKVLNCEIARAVYQAAVKEEVEPEVYLDLYEIAAKFPFAHVLREEIYKDMVNACDRSPCLVKLRAQRVLLGLEVIVVKEEVIEASNNMLAKEKLMAVLAVYDQGFRCKDSRFFNTYTEELLGILYECWGVPELMKMIIEKLLEIIRFHKKKLLPLQYIIWYHILRRKPGSKEAVTELMMAAVQKYIEAPPFQFEIAKEMFEDEDIPMRNRMRRFRHLAMKARGAFGIEVWEYLLSMMSTRKQKIELYNKACIHKDDTISKCMRVRYLDWINNHRPIKRSRLMYYEFGTKPPFSNKLHAHMVKGEITKKYGDMNFARFAFENAVQQFGKTEPGLWLTYIYFEKFAGEPMNSLALFTRAEKELEAEPAEKFRELYSITVETLGKQQQGGQKRMRRAKRQLAGERKKNVVWVTGKKTKEEIVEEKPPAAAVRLFEEELTLTYSVDQERKELFSSIYAMLKFWETGSQLDLEEDGSEWEEVLELMIGEKIPLSMQPVQVKDKAPPKEKTPESSVNLSKKNKKKKKEYELSDRLDPGPEKKMTNGSKGDLEKILDSSLTLKPEFHQQTQLQPYFVGKAKAKAVRKKEREKTKGPGWNNMKAPEMTEEVKRDIEILQMRHVLDPKKPFKNKDVQVVPKYFQMGKIIDSPVDFYSSRIPKKKRKRTMAEEILHDEESLRYQKRKYNEIISKKQKLHPKNRASGEKKVKKLKKDLGS